VLESFFLAFYAKISGRLFTCTWYIDLLVFKDIGPQLFDILRQVVNVNLRFLIMPWQKDALLWVNCLELVF